MKYGIITKDDVIAKFEHESDRDVCIEALRKIYTDCKFETVDNLNEEVVDDTVKERVKEEIAKEQTDESVN